MPGGKQQGSEVDENARFVVSCSWIFESYLEQPRRPAWLRDRLGIASSMESGSHMLELIAAHREQIAELCRHFQVQRLDVFGSAARETDFDPERSDVDFLVSYRPEQPGPGLPEYFALRDALSELLGRPVDLVMAGAVENPFVRAGIERSRQVLFAA